jgi:hypothetical protein
MKNRSRFSMPRILLIMIACPHAIMSRQRAMFGKARQGASRTKDESDMYRQCRENDIPKQHCD